MHATHYSTTWIRLPLAILAAAVALLALPNQALAWGPGVHLSIGNGVLENLSCICPLIANLLTVHGRSFLYGSISADIFIGKGSSFKPRHSHNWETGFALLRGDPRPEMKAYAYGYLSHLAADTVAHNYYVPNLLGLTPVAGRLGHVYLEMLADQRVEWSATQAQELFGELGINAQDRCLLSAVAQKPLTFRFKKGLFKGGLRVAASRTLPGPRRMAGLAPRLAASGDYLEDMLELSWRAVIDFLRDPEDSPARGLDPIGSDNLRMASRSRRRQARLLRQRGFMPLFPIWKQLSRLPAVDEIHVCAIGE